MPRSYRAVRSAAVVAVGADIMGQVPFSARNFRAVYCGVIGLILCALPCAAQESLPEQLSTELSSGDAGLSPSQEDILEMDLEQLSQVDVLVPAMDLEVTTVSRQESTVGRSPAAVFVITPEMIRRSGARRVPDLLRMVPGVEVAQIDANKWAISIRGFNNRFANKLLVLIDGRSVYNQAFSGVYWDEIDLVLEDIERIEVIRGPGGTVWGANAVNGIINIITKPASATQGLLVQGGGGTEERGFGTVRYGARIGDDFHWRIYGKQFERDGGDFIGTRQFDDWRQVRGGFRTEWLPTDCDVFTLQGDWFQGTSGTGLNTFTLGPPPAFTQVFYDTNARGQNLLWRWTHVIDDDSDWSVQSYYDRIHRSDPFSEETQEKADVDFQHRFPLNPWNNIIWGLGYRHVDDDLIYRLPATGFFPQRKSTSLYSCFLQDEITLEEDRWYLTVGSKFEHNAFSGFEAQPTVRLLHLPSERESLWAAVSRAVRTPNRVEEDIVFTSLASTVGPVFSQIDGNRLLSAEDLTAFEVGYRAQPQDDFSWDLALFYNDYHNLIGIAPDGAPFIDPTLGGLVIPLTFANDLSADTYGAELASTLRLTSRWEVTGSYTLLYLDVHAPAGDLIQGSSPHNQLYLRSSWNPRCDWELDVIGRYVDNLPALGVPSYFTMDVRLAWRPLENLEWSVVGRNLVDSPHTEFVEALAGTLGTDVQAEVFTMLTWTY